MIAIRAAELYQTKPNDPAIVQWKNALQLAINNTDSCFDIESAISCQNIVSTITSNCETHPNEILACNDTRLGQYPLILEKALDAKKRLKKRKKRLQKNK